MNVSKKAFGKFIRAKRKEKGISIGMLSEKLNVSYDVVWKWEKGIRFPDFETLGLLAESLSISVQELYDGAKENKENKKNNLITKIIVLAVCFLIGGLTLVHINSTKSENESDVYANERTDAIQKYFPDAEYVSKEAFSDGEVNYTYKTDKYEITTNEVGDKILVVTVLNPYSEPANREGIKEKAISLLNEILDVKYELEVESIEKRGTNTDITIVETKNGIQTGLRGNFYFSQDGRLIMFGFIDRVLDNPEEDIIISEEEAIKIAIDYFSSNRTDLSDIKLYKDVTRMTARSGQVYQLTLVGMNNDTEIYCTCSIEAKSGEILSTGFSDY